MNEPNQASKAALETAEQILRTIYGEDFKGCNVSLDTVAVVVDEALTQRIARIEDPLRSFLKVMHTIEILATPPDRCQVADPKQLQAILIERLDAIRSTASKTVAIFDGLK